MALMSGGQLHHPHPRCCVGKNTNVALIMHQVNENNKIRISNKHQIVHCSVLHAES